MQTATPGKVKHIVKKADHTKKRKKKRKVHFKPVLHWQWHCFIYQEHRMHKYFLIWLLNWRWHDWKKKLLIQLKFHLNSCVCDSCQKYNFRLISLALEKLFRKTLSKSKREEKTGCRKIWSSLFSLYLKMHQKNLLWF